MKKVLVVGGGPAGMMAAGVAAQKGHEVHLFEKNSRLGKKLGITGKGRCNLTNDSDIENFMEQINGNTKFLYSAFYQWKPKDVMNFFATHGVKTKVERGNRVFPVSDRAYDVIQAFIEFLIQTGVHIHCNTEVKDLWVENDQLKGILFQNGTYESGEAVIIATGGLSYPKTGSTGQGYIMAKKVGHSITPCFPSLVPLVAKEKWVTDLQGLSLKNVKVTMKTQKGKILYQDFGEMMFTHYGVSGPIILSASRSIVPYKESIDLYIDLKPSLDIPTLDRRIIRDLEKFKMKDFNNSLYDLLPKALIPIVIQLSEISPDKKTHLITKEERKRLIHVLKEMKITIIGNRGYSEAIVTAGGVKVQELSPKTMESKYMKGLYFVGEVLDVDGYTGGYNLQIAFSTGYVAGSHIY
ncbi:MAG: NAD(P)/FAD-dependent oxidoreductase [Epulopiscium sp.]|nr:NAD(P)/FAD-dependent oxidoreductase [Candidatus Epulonipiscium sp.]